jgi:quinol-cytochrome oxidoreductase complex cytochrome b subunit
MSLVLFLLLATTGALMTLVYEPSTGRAYESILRLQNDVFYGKLVRNIHHWSANFLIAVVFLHLLRVYFTGAYYAPRRLNWVIGLALLLCIVMANFTGYLLPWDQLSYWATTIVTGMIEYVPGIGGWLRNVIRGGRDIGSATLINFYTFHTTVVPILMISLMAWHFWRVRKARGVVVPRALSAEAPSVEASSAEVVRKTAYVPALPNLLLRELAVAMVLVAFIMVFSLFFDAPLSDAANQGMSPNPAKAPWYFVGIQELLFHFHPLFAVVVIPLLAAGGLVLIPFLRYDTDTSGIFMVSRQGRRMAAIAAISALGLTPLLIVLDEFWIDFTAWLPGLPPLVSNGLLPTIILLVALGGFCAVLKCRFAASRNEVTQALFVLLTIVFVVLTVTGVWFRGAGMALVWPG